MNDKQEKGAMQVDVALVRELAALLDDTHLTEIEVEDGDRKIRVARKAGGGAPIYAPSFAPAPATPAAPTAAPVAASAAELAAPAGTMVRSPIVGTAYLSAEPGAAPFARVGAQVAAGETILIVEAMKVMNAIPAPSSGTIKAVLVDNGQPVEYDQPLIVIE
ncbi:MULTISPECIES: acetyl-CoA carboxylase biotin carboxyl carrier protein [Sphingobium]|uniref:acetyl-CoA carboxylase biotin carboxyl carrier protein n=1 Tax=Sphingobium TaxID=165695 RepID=UPI00036BA075|nr:MULTISPECIES: acetyl-CoA carboxylase biotin carboxyl carrier protein [Sphingobium]MBG6119238.1 acetyl-CoA carboxylase biotin carboxyl carrier protein [Sphingobium sp. JAI105]PSO11729.1 acetyl-CoA carboxylase biotin carboxyl carrier protein [Sphingobium sp. AEW4]TWD01508.1 acetyl-CoA carboxylase biotin carboxyl carrier protein [Sphingobium sp. AEW010]TWD20160.1 acetyl-CoA carboxylase biotin carboxyl carrier protein [Sphingobium sp. AEW013]TWD23117.1 acetyl-CoA carboxylase biotin carboxyl car